LHFVGVELALFVAGLYVLGDPFPPYVTLLLAAALGWCPRWTTMLWRNRAQRSLSHVTAIEILARLLFAVGSVWCVSVLLLIAAMYVSIALQNGIGALLSAARSPDNPVSIAWAIVILPPAGLALWIAQRLERRAVGAVPFDIPTEWWERAASADLTRAFTTTEMLAYYQRRGLTRADAIAAIRGAVAELRRGIAAFRQRRSTVRRHCGNTRSRSD
jgi:hypothetical protein